MSKLAGDLQQTNTIITRFVSCCDGTEILFSGVPGLETGNVYTFISATPVSGEGGELIPNQCYTYFREISQGATYPITPTAAEFNLAAGGCEDGDACAECDPQPLCECPEGFTYNGATGLCERTLETVAEYTGGLLPIVSGSKNTAYGKFGLRLYPDISSLTWPLLGSGPQATYTVNENNGAGAAVIPTDNVQNEAFGSTVVGCNTGSTGGRLNKAGIWATGFPNNQELSFEFCVDISGDKEKQYLIGIAGDNKIKFYIDGSLAVFLDATSSVTRPFNHWHTFPLTLTPGTHTIKLSGLNLGSSAAFAAEIYDIDLATFQANLSPAVGPGNCGNTEAQLEPYIIFSTRDYIGQSVPDPNNPGVWSCPDGSEVDYCEGVPICKILEEVPLDCDCYLIIPCDGTEPFVSIDESYAPYENTFVEVSGPEYTGCAYVVLTDTEFCNDTLTTTVPTGVACDCTLTCWFVQGSNGFSIVDDDDNFITISAIDASPFIRICSKIPPVPEEGTDLTIYSAIETGGCVKNAAGKESAIAKCPDQCFLLKNCITGEVIASNSDVLYQYALTSNTVVEILGEEGCWEVSLEEPGVDDCDCLVDVTVVRSYETCDDCIKPIYYKLTSCEGNGVIYSYLNLEAYVGQVIKTDCGCYKVEVIDYEPPNFQDIKFEGLYTDCVSCTRTYYELVDCAGVADNIYTYTDLSSYVGQTIKIENCDECWTVNLVDNPESIYAGAGVVVVTESHANCVECGEDLVCTCSQVTNYSELETRTYTYIDCDNEVQTITLAPHESSGRICILEWLSEEFCNCFGVTFYVDFELVITFNAEFTGNYLNGYPIYTLTAYPVFGNIVYPMYTVAVIGGEWVIIPGEDNTNPNDIIYYLPTAVDEGLLNCPIGDWYQPGNGPGDVDILEVSSAECPDTCPPCIEATVTTETGTTIYQWTYFGVDGNGNIMYQDEDGNFIMNNGKVWTITIGTEIFTSLVVECPDTTFTGLQGGTITAVASDDCPTPDTPGGDFVQTDYFETFGECQHGVCPPRTFPNKRVITPGYNTPICTPEKYDMITCNFADVMYKIVLEKRYGITNCCPEDDHKWMVKKELIDLQALKDPDYECSECGCNDHLSNNCSTCKSGN
jgi:hypothetical protein